MTRRTHTGMLCFGASRPQDEASLIWYLQAFSDDLVLEALVPRLGSDDIEQIVALLTGMLKKHFSDEEYHRIFLKDAVPDIGSERGR